MARHNLRRAAFSKEDDRNLANFILKIQTQQRLKRSAREVSASRRETGITSRLAQRKSLGQFPFNAERQEDFFGFLEEETKNKNFFQDTDTGTTFARLTPKGAPVPVTFDIVNLIRRGKRVRGITNVDPLTSKDIIAVGLNLDRVKLVPFGSDLVTRRGLRKKSNLQGIGDFFGGVAKTAGGLTGLQSGDPASLRTLIPMISQLFRGQGQQGIQPQGAQSGIGQVAQGRQTVSTSQGRTFLTPQALAFQRQAAGGQRQPITRQPIGQQRGGQTPQQRGQAALQQAIQNKDVRAISNALRKSQETLQQIPKNDPRRRAAEQAQQQIKRALSELV